MKKTPAHESDGNSELLRMSSEKLFETLMEQTADYIYIKDKKSRFITVSQAFADVHNIKDRKEIEGKTDFDFFTDEHAMQAFDDEQTILRTDKPIINKIEKESWHDGKVTWVSTSKAPFHLTSGEIAGIFGISRDVTSEVLARQKLADSEQRLREQNEIMRSDYESAEKVQRVIIPGRVPVIRNVELGYVWKPMSGIGGDLFSFPRNPSKNLLFFMADVCGHGVTAAFYTVLLKYFSAHAGEVYSGDPRQFLNSVNEELSLRLSSGFITGLAGHFGRRDKEGNRKLYIAHAGNPRLLIHRKNKDAIEVVDLPPGIVMGIPGGQASSTSKFLLSPGDRLYTYTDGIIEASDEKGEEFGEERFIEALGKHRDLPIQETLDKVYEKACAYTNSKDQQDDITLLGFELT
ncbi:MAG: SpoIIE family protein phosphatase [Verrucomicrobiota bacterium]